MNPRGISGAAADVRRQQVRARYGRIASEGRCCSVGRTRSICRADETEGASGDLKSVAPRIGYSTRDLAILPEGANLGLGCGNSTAIRALRPGQVVLDVGSGAGIDCFLEARKVGTKGRVIGVDMTPEMIRKARENARKRRYGNVEFRLGEIERLPVADESVDVVISNCVINLVSEKARAYREAFRVLRPGGRLAISDVVATRPISAGARADPSLWSSCSSGALEVPAIKTFLKRAGFAGVRLDLKIPEALPNSLRGQAWLGVVAPDLQAVKPRGGR